MSSSSNPGRFIAFEGADGVGKSTCLRLVAERLSARGVDLITTREPGGSSGAEDIRALLVNGDPGRWLPTTELLLHAAAQVEHVERVIRPALAAGRWVLCDRFVGSSLAYQGFGMQLGQDAVMQVHQLATGGLMPDLTVVLDVPPQLSQARLSDRAAGEDRYEQMTNGFMERARQGYRSLAADPGFNAVLVDADGERDQVADRVLSVIGERLECQEC